MEATQSRRPQNQRLTHDPTLPPSLWTPLSDPLCLYRLNSIIQPLKYTKESIPASSGTVKGFASTQMDVDTVGTGTWEK